MAVRGRFREAGVNEIAIVTGYKRELLRGVAWSSSLTRVRAETNMVSSLACAEAWLVADTGQSVTRISSRRSVGGKPACELHGATAVAYDANWLASWQKRFGDPLLDAETFRLKPYGTLSEIGNTPQSIGAIDGQYMGLLRLYPRVLVG